MIATPKQLRAAANLKQSIKIAQTVRDCKAHQTKTEAEISKLYAPILAGYAFTTDKCEEIRPITKSEQVYLSNDDARVAQYFDDCQHAIEAAEYKVDPGSCPALIAGHETIKAERKLVDHWVQFFPDLNFDDVICSGLDKLKEWIDLILKMTPKAA